MLESENPKSPLFGTLSKMPFIMQIIMGLGLGIIAAIIYPNDSTIIPTFGTLFVKALKAVAPILIFVLVSSAIAKHKSGMQTNLKPIILLYFAGMILSGTLALVMSYVFPSTFTELAKNAGVSAPQGIKEVLVNFVTQAVENPVSAFINCNFVAILMWSIALGLMFRISSDLTKKVLDDLAIAVSGVIRMVIRCAPLGVFGLVYSSCTQEGGFLNLLNYVHVVAVLVITMLIIAFIINPALVFFTTHKNPYPLVLKCLARSGTTAFFTRSSAANLPVNLALCEEMGLDKQTYTISIPLGCTINMSGAGVTIVIMTMATAHTLGIEVGYASAFLMCIASVLCACGSSGVAGGSLMLIPLACSIFGIPSDIAMQVIGIGFIIGVVQDSCETALNSSTDVIFTAAACERAKSLQSK